MTTNGGELISIREAARILGVSPTTAYRWVASGHLPIMRLRGRGRVPRAALREWLDSRVEQALDTVRRRESVRSGSEAVTAGPWRDSPASLMSLQSATPPGHSCSRPNARSSERAPLEARRGES